MKECRDLFMIGAGIHDSRGLYLYTFLHIRFLGCFLLNNSCCF